MHLGRLLSSAPRTRLALKAGFGTAAGLGAVGCVQGLYHMSQYHPLPDPQGPLRGVVQYLREKQQENLANHGARGLGAAPSASANADAPATAQPSRLVRALTRGSVAAAPGDEACARKNILFVGDSLVVGVGCDSGSGPTLPRACAAFLSKALRADVTWAAIGETGADVAVSTRSLSSLALWRPPPSADAPRAPPVLRVSQGLNNLLPLVGAEVRRAQDRGGSIDMVVVVCGLNDFKRAYTSLSRTGA